MIHLYRHAHAGRREDWDRPDEERPLSEHGWKQAEAVAERLAAAGITRILTSPYVRCVQSVEPLSERTGIAIEIETSLAEYTPGERVDAFVADLEPGAVLCSHGDIVSGLIGRIAAEGVDLEGDLVWQKGSVWTLETSASGRIVAGRYEGPPLTTA
jgi:8-oxo-dGTP diphosphatase